MLKASIALFVCLAAAGAAVAQTPTRIPSGTYPKGAGQPGTLPPGFDAEHYGAQQARDDFYCAGVLQQWWRQHKADPNKIMEVVSLTTPLASAATDALLMAGANAAMITKTSDTHSKHGSADYSVNHPRISVDTCKARQQQLPQYPPKPQ